MVRDDADWKNQPRHAFNWLSVALAVLLVAIYLAIWASSGDPASLALGVFLGVWIGVYFTRYWQPILYLPAAIVLGATLGVELVTGAPNTTLDQVAFVTNVAFLAVTVYLLANEETHP